MNPLSEDPDIAEDARIQHMDAIERAGDLGLLYAVIHMVGYRAGTDRDTWPPLWEDYLGNLSDFARVAGLVLCVENTSYGFFLQDLVRIVDRVHSPWLRITLDTGHALIPGSRTARLTGCPHMGYDSMEAFVRQEHDKIFSLHVHDNDGQTDQPPAHWRRRGRFRLSHGPGRNRHRWPLDYGAYHRRLGQHRPRRAPAERTDQYDLTESTTV